MVSFQYYKCLGQKTRRLVGYRHYNHLGDGGVGGQALLYFAWVHIPYVASKYIILARYIIEKALVVSLEKVARAIKSRFTEYLGFYRRVSGFRHLPIFKHQIIAGHPEFADSIGLCYLFAVIVDNEYANTGQSLANRSRSSINLFRWQITDAFAFGQAVIGEDLNVGKCSANAFYMAGIQWLTAAGNIA